MLNLLRQGISAAASGRHTGANLPCGASSSKSTACGSAYRETSRSSPTCFSSGRERSALRVQPMLTTWRPKRTHVFESRVCRGFMQTPPVPCHARACQSRPSPRAALQREGRQRPASSLLADKEAARTEGAGWTSSAQMFTLRFPFYSESVCNLISHFISYKKCILVPRASA